MVDSWGNYVCYLHNSQTNAFICRAFISMFDAIQLSLWNFLSYWSPSFVHVWPLIWYHSCNTHQNNDLPLDGPINCCASMHFGENLLDLGSSGISALTTTHLLIWLLYIIGYYYCHDEIHFALQGFKPTTKSWYTCQTFNHYGNIYDIILVIIRYLEYFCSHPIIQKKLLTQFNVQSFTISQHRSSRKYIQTFASTQLLKSRQRFLYMKVVLVYHLR